MRGNGEDLENFFLSPQDCVSQTEQNSAYNNPRYVEYLYDRLKGKSKLLLLFCLFSPTLKAVRYWRKCFKIFFIPSGSFIKIWPSTGSFCRTFRFQWIHAMHWQIVLCEYYKNAVGISSFSECWHNLTCGQLKVWNVGKTLEAKKTHFISTWVCLLWKN